MTREDLPARRLAELAWRAARDGCAVSTRFLEPPQEADALEAARGAGVRVAFFGGWDGAERRAACFAGEGAAFCFPVQALEIRWNARYAQIAHRDLLGALMALGVERDLLGDIALEPGRAVAFVHRDVADYLAASLQSAGRASVRAAALPPGAPIPEPQGTLRYRTVACPRLDALLCAAWDLSRAEAQRRIAAQTVKVNHLPQTQSDLRLRPGDLISARGLGRARLEKLSGPTRKGRLGVHLLVYGK